jgi:hypothetical protein
MIPVFRWFFFGAAALAAGLAFVNPAANAQEVCSMFVFKSAQRERSEVAEDVFKKCPAGNTLLISSQESALIAMLCNFNKPVIVSGGTTYCEISKPKKLRFIE